MGKDEVLQQDLSKEAQVGGVCPIHLLFEKEVALPSEERMTAVMEKHLEEVECFTYEENMASFLAKKYLCEFQDVSLPPQLMVSGCNEFNGEELDAITRSQMWDCPESEEILAGCKYQMIALDMLASAMQDYKERADMLMDFMEALVEMFPECVAVWFQNSGKLFTRDRIVDHQIPREDRYVFFAVNVRFFNIQGTGDYLVDTLGMSTLYLPDLQYHFHDMDPNWVVNHAYNLLSYIFDNNAPIRSGETIDGIADGHMEESIRWKCQYEDALIQPAREVMDICMNEYAAGQRE